MATYSGKTTVAAAGTAVKLGSRNVHGPLMVKADPVNVGLIYVGNVNGDIDSGNSMPLSAGECVVFDHVESLEQVYIDTSVNGSSAEWLMLVLD